MILHEWQPDELYTLLDDLCDGTLTECSAARLDEILRDDSAARREYLAYLSIHAELGVNRILGEGKAGSGLPMAVGQSLPSEILPSTSPIPPSSPIRQPQSSSHSIPLSFFGSAYHGTVGFFSQEVPFGILVATLVFIVGGIIGSIMTVNQYTQFAGQSRPSTERSFAAGDAADKARTTAKEKEVQWVGRITGMVDCKWSDDKDFLPPVGNYVALGRKYKLDSGLMKITYNTGAEVILQGPVTYQVESANGGYMSLGKLTGKIEEDKAKGFFVRTPTAVVTDLGTEFGVEVGEGGACEVQVFQGLVEAAALHDGKPAGPPCRLVQGQVARLVRDDAGSSAAGKFVVAEKQADPKRFARKMHVPGRVVCTYQTGAFGGFTVAKDDLVNAGQPTFSKIEPVPGNAGFGASDIHKLNDGEIYAGLDKSFSEETFQPYEGSVVVMTLNTTLHPLGYDIRSIVSLTGSAGTSNPIPPGQDRSSQKYDVAYSTVGDPDRFIAMRGNKDATVDCTAHGFEEEQVTLRSGSGAPIVSGVAMLRFTFHNTKSIHPESMYREIDVFGEPTAAEDKNTPQNAKK